MMLPVVRVIAFVLLVTPVVVQAGPLKLVFGAGAVSIDADKVPLGTILDEWARLGGTRVDGIDKLSEVAVTFHVEGIPEDEALAALLKGRNGYSTVLRKAGEAGASQFARIAVLSPTRQPIARPSTVPKDWPFLVNEHPDGADEQPPTSEVVIDRPGIDYPWPFEINENPEVNTATPSTSLESVGLPGIDYPWPLPINLQPALEADPPTTVVPTGMTPGVDVPWPFEINLNPEDPDAPAPDPEALAAAKAATEKAAAEKAAADKAKTKGAPVSTKAPKPIPPKQPPVRPKR